MEDQVNDDLTTAGVYLDWSVSPSKMGPWAELVRCHLVWSFSAARGHGTLVGSGTIEMSYRVSALGRICVKPRIQVYYTTIRASTR